MTRRPSSEIDIYRVWTRSPFYSDVGRGRGRGARRERHDVFLVDRGLGRGRDFAHDAAFTHDKCPVGNADEFGQIARDHEDAEAPYPVLRIIDGQVDRLGQTAGITGRSAQSALPRFRDIATSFDHASRVFEDRSLVEYERRTERAFRSGFTELRPNACGALISLVYNRGAAMTGDSRREMRNLRDNCIPKQDYACIASEIRSMKRLWRGTVNENGLSARREAEAILVETP